MTASTHRRFKVSVSPIQDDDDLEQAIAALGKVLDAEPNTSEDAQREVLSELIYAYEQKHYPISPPDPLDAINFRLEQGGLTRKALEPLLGGRSKVAEVLNGTRDLSKAMIRRLHKELGIPLASLMGS